MTTQSRDVHITATGLERRPRGQRYITIERRDDGYEYVTMQNNVDKGLWGSVTIVPPRGVGWKKFDTRSDSHWVYRRKSRIDGNMVVSWRTGDVIFAYGDVMMEVETRKKRKAATEKVK